MERCCDHIYLASGDIMPFNRDFRDGYLLHFREQQKLDVEDPRRHMLGREDSLGSRTREELESTLCISKLTDPYEPESQTQCGGEDPSNEWALARFKSSEPVAVYDLLLVADTEGDTKTDFDYSTDFHRSASDDHSRRIMQCNDVHCIP